MTSTRCCLLSLLLAGIAALPAPAVAGNITLAWDPNPEENVEYSVAYGTQSGSLTESSNVGAATTATISNLVDGQRYYFVVYAHISGLVSTPSNEVSGIVPN